MNRISVKLQRADPGAFTRAVGAFEIDPRPQGIAAYVAR